MEKKYLEVIVIKGWADGSGWSYEQDYETNMVDEIPESLSVSDVWNADGKQEDSDTRIIVSYYSADDDELESPIKVFRFWESDLFDD